MMLGIHHHGHQTDKHGVCLSAGPSGQVRLSRIPDHVPRMSHVLLTCQNAWSLQD